MRKLLALLLLSPFAFANKYAEPGDVPSVEATCNFYWEIKSDIKECLQSFKKAKNIDEVYLPTGAEMKTSNELEKAGKSVMTIPIEEQNKVEPVRRINCSNTDLDCKKRKSKVFQKIWRDEIKNKYFELTSDSREYFVLYADGTLKGYTFATNNDDDGENFGFDMSGAWEISDYSYTTEDKGFIDLYAGKLQCTYEISKKGSLYWLEQMKANYNNICPDMLMKTKTKP